MASATIVGGKSVKIDLSGHEAVIAKDALANLSSLYSSSKVLTAPFMTPAPTPSSLDVYQINSAQYNAVTAAAGAEAIVVTGGNGVNIHGNAGVNFIAGGKGNDTINAGGGNATIVGGGGTDLIQLADSGQAGGTAYISLASGNDTVRLWGGNATIVDATLNDKIEIFSGNNTVDVNGKAVFAVSGGTNSISSNGGNFTVSGGTSTIDIDGASASIVRTGGAVVDVTLQSTPTSTVPGALGKGAYSLTGDMTVHQTAAGNYTMALNGSDTVYLGAGNDTITQFGSSTIYGGSGRLNYSGGNGADSVKAGSGAATILGGGGFDTIIGGSGLMKADGGQGADLLVGGSFKDTLTGGAGGDMFRFASSSAGGQHVIMDFVHGSDKIDLSGGGYTLADISQTTVKSGSTIIKLHDGTQITLKNFTGVNTSDFI